MSICSNFNLYSLKNGISSFLYFLKVSKGSRNPPSARWQSCIDIAPSWQIENIILPNCGQNIFSFVRCLKLLLKFVPFLSNAKVQQGVTELSYHSGIYIQGPPCSRLAEKTKRSLDFFTQIFQPGGVWVHLHYKLIKFLVIHI